MASSPARPAVPPAGDPSPSFRRSLRASQARRAAVARRARRLTRGRRTLVVAALAVSALGGGAVAAPPPPSHTTPAHRPSSSAAVVAAVQRALGITVDGVWGPQTRRAVLRFQRATGLTVDGIIGPQTLGALGLAPQTTSPAREAARTAGASSLLEAIALCESGGDPTLVSPSGQYRGKYQFDRPTWRSVGGSGDPARAPEAEQDRRATTLMARQGPSAWPACSQKVGAAR